MERAKPRYDRAAVEIVAEADSQIIGVPECLTGLTGPVARRGDLVAHDVVHPDASAVPSVVIRMNRSPDARLPTSPMFGRDGYVLLPRLLSAAEVTTARKAVSERLAAPSDSACRRPNNTLVPLRWNDPIIDTVLGCDARVDRLRDAIDGSDLRWISGYISVKDPHSPSLWWHQDWWCWNHPATYQPAPVQVALLCYLSDTDLSTGALRVLPGSHLHSMSLHTVLPEAHGNGAAGLDLAHPAMSDHPDQVTLDLRAGDAVALDYRLLHGTHPNAGPHRRDCILLSFTPAWNWLPEDLRGHLISHHALPNADEDVTQIGWPVPLLPDYAGPRADLELIRNAPVHYVVGRTTGPTHSVRATDS